MDIAAGPVTSEEEVEALVLAGASHIFVAPQFETDFSPGRFPSAELVGVVAVEEQYPSWWLVPTGDGPRLVFVRDWRQSSPQGRELAEEAVQRGHMLVLGAYSMDHDEDPVWCEELILETPRGLKPSAFVVSVIYSFDEPLQYLENEAGKFDEDVVWEDIWALTQKYSVWLNSDPRPGDVDTWRRRLPNAKGWVFWRWNTDKHPAVPVGIEMPKMLALVAALRSTLNSQP
ncbi:MAG: hypothetical protein ACI9KE_006453 [Polyangiales bacterium]|jgi:hypothetical protein